MFFRPFGLYAILPTLCVGSTLCAWDVTPLRGPATGDYVEAHSINDSGTVAGFFLNDAGRYQPATWTGEQFHAVTVDDFIVLSPLAINNAGRVASYAVSYSPADMTTSSAGFVYDAGQLLTLQQNGQATFWPAALNDTGIIAGALPAGVAATLDTATGAITEFGRFGAAGAGFTTINDNGLLAGTLSFAGRPDAKAFAVDHGQFIPLPDLGGNHAFPASVSQLGLIVGQASDVTGRYHATAWDNGQISILPSLSSSGHSAASDVNDAGLIVGAAWAGDATHAVLWADRQPIDLNTLLPADSLWTLTSATAINNSGQIVGNGTYDGRSAAFLLTPTSNSGIIPEPAALLSLATPAALLLVPRPRRPRRPR